MPKLYQGQQEECYISIQDSSTSIHAFIVNSEGKEFLDGNLFTVNAQGELVVHDGVNPTAAEKAGILLDDEGRIKTNL